MGSPALHAGDRLVDWMKLRASAPPGLPAGAQIHPPGRSVHQWRDGLPGDAPTRVTPGGVPLVLERADALDLAALDAWVDSIPRAGMWLVMIDADGLELRAQAPATDDPVACARRLIELAARFTTR